MNDRLPSIINEHERDGIGELIYGLIAEALGSQLWRYPLALVLGRAVDHLDDQIREELIVEFAEHLLDGRLAEALAHATGERHFLFLLRMRARQFLQNRMRGGERENIAARTLRILRNSNRFVWEQRAEARWSIRGGPQRPVTWADDDLRRLARALPVPASLRRFRRNTEIASAVITDDDLEGLIVKALEEVGGSLSLGQFRVLLNERLKLLPTETISVYRRTENEPALEDKLVQRAVVEVLNAIYELDFLGFSYGFRPGRSPHHALDALSVGLLTKKVNWVLDADIRGFFDTLDHGWLMRFIEHRVADRRIVRLIQKWLAAGVLEDGHRTVSEVGTVQGGSVSPLLANLYLHYVFDLWVQRWRTTQAHGDVVVVRFADDFVVGFQHRKEAERFLTGQLPAPNSAPVALEEK